MNYSSIYSLRPADRLIESVFQTGISKHHAIYLGRDPQGIEWISENDKFRGVRLIRASEFFNKNKAFRVEHFYGTYNDREIAVKRALNRVGQPYNLISYNCEHYASYVQTGRAESMQVNNVIEGVKILSISALIIGLTNLFIND